MLPILNNWIWVCKLDLSRPDECQFGFGGGSDPCVWSRIPDLKARPGGLGGAWEAPAWEVSGSWRPPQTLQGSIQAEGWEAPGSPGRPWGAVEGASGGLRGLLKRTTCGSPA